MNRRSFLQFLGLAPALPIAAKVLEQTPERAAGNFVPMHGTLVEPHRHGQWKPFEGPRPEQVMVLDSIPRGQAQAGQAGEVLVTTPEGAAQWASLSNADIIAATPIRFVRFGD